MKIERIALLAALGIGVYLLYKKGAFSNLGFSVPASAAPNQTVKISQPSNPKAQPKSGGDFFNPNGNATLIDAPQASLPDMGNRLAKFEIPNRVTGGVPMEVLPYATDQAVDPTRQFVTTAPTPEPTLPLYGNKNASAAPEVAGASPLPQRLGLEVNAF